MNAEPEIVTREEIEQRMAITHRHGVTMFEARLVKQHLQAMTLLEDHCKITDIINYQERETKLIDWHQRKATLLNQWHGAKGGE